MARIRLENLAHSYRHNPTSEDDYALKQLDYVWEDGKAYALLGSSGCGKTTLLNIISGLMHPSKGRLLFNDRDVTDTSAAERNIAQVFQFPVVYDTMTVEQNLAFPLKNRRFDAAYIQSKVQKVAAMMGLEANLRRKAQGLTADLKQKISLGRGIVREDVNAILFDEPLTVIDPQMKWELRDQLKTLHRECEHTMIYVTHDQTEALTFADQVVVMYNGRVVQTGTPQALFERPEHTYVGYFIGSPGMNLLDARIKGTRAQIGRVQVDLGADYGLPKGKTQIGFRCESASLRDTGSTGFEVQVTRVEDAGRYKIIRVAHQGISINLIAGEGYLPPGNTADLQIDKSQIHVYLDDWRITATE